jgi:glycosyltransferase involved in cell wall biosynthesis
MKALTLSIVIPVYNEEHHLEACLDSIATQTMRPDEVIIVDNNSTDSSVEIARNYPFVRIVTERKQGIVFARDKGFNSARSTIIGRIDADTVLPADWVERVKDFYADAHHSDHALTGGGYFYNVVMPRFNGWVQSQFAYRWNRFITGHYILWGSNMAFPRSMWHKVRSEVCVNDALHEDLDLAMHIAEHGYAIDYRANLRVGVKLKRVWENQDQMSFHLNRWPESLRVHGYGMWWLGTVGNWIIWFLLLFIRPLYNGATRTVRFIRWSLEPMD